MLPGNSRIGTPMLNFEKCGDRIDREIVIFSSEVFSAVEGHMIIGRTLSEAGILVIAVDGGKDDSKFLPRAF